MIKASLCMLMKWGLGWQDALDSVVELREADVPYHIRFCIDRDVRCGHWYTVTAKASHPCLAMSPAAGRAHH